MKKIYITNEIKKSGATLEYVRNSFLSLLELKGRCSGTIASYSTTINQFILFLNKNNIYNIEEVTELHINIFQEALITCGYEFKTIINKIYVLNAFLRFIRNQNWTICNFYNLKKEKKMKDLYVKKFDDLILNYKLDTISFNGSKEIIVIIKSGGNTIRNRRVYMN